MSKWKNGYSRTPFNDRDTDGRGSSLGWEAEKAYAAIMQRRGWVVTKATEAQDKYEHWDFLIEKENHRLKVDVKAQKRIRRWDDQLSDRWVWLEVYNNYGMPGWALENKADYFAFQRQEGFLMVKSDDLRMVVKNLVMNLQVDRPDDASYCLYQRKGRQDALTRIRYSDLSPYATWVE